MTDFSANQLVAYKVTDFSANQLGPYKVTDFSANQQRAYKVLKENQGTLVKQNYLFNLSTCLKWYTVTVSACYCSK